MENQLLTAYLTVVKDYSDLKLSSKLETLEVGKLQKRVEIMEKVLDDCLGMLRSVQRTPGRSTIPNEKLNQSTAKAEGHKQSATHSEKMEKLTEKYGKGL